MAFESWLGSSWITWYQIEHKETDCEDIQESAIVFQVPLWAFFSFNSFFTKKSMSYSGSWVLKLCIIIMLKSLATFIWRNVFPKFDDLYISYSIKGFFIIPILIFENMICKTVETMCLLKFIHTILIEPILIFVQKVSRHHEVLNTSLQWNFA